MAAEIGPEGMRMRAERLQELAKGLSKEHGQAASGRGVLAWQEQQDYLKHIREAADGLERAREVLLDALRRMARSAA